LMNWQILAAIWQRFIIQIKTVLYIFDLS